MRGNTNHSASSFESNRGEFDLQQFIADVERIGIWKHEALSQADRIYQLYENRVFERFKYPELGDAAREHFDTTASMAKYLWGYATDLVSTRYRQNQIFEAMVLYTSAGYFLDDDNDQEKAGSKVLANSQEFLRQVSKIFDQATDNPKEAMAFYRQRHEKSPGDKRLMLSSVAADLMGIIRLNSSDNFVRSFKNQLMSHWFESFTTPKTHIPKTVEDYISKRRLTGGMRPTIALVEVAMGIEVTQELRQQLPWLDVATTAVADFGGLLNDLCSSPKELLDEKADFNLVRVIQVRKNVSYREAIRASLEIVDSCFQRFMRARREIVRHVEAMAVERKIAVSLYLSGLDQIVWASVHWQLDSGRYHHPYHPLTELVKDIG